MVKVRSIAMCGRFTLIAMPQSLLGELALPASEFRPRYNIAPPQASRVVLHECNSSPAVQELRWGLIPFRSPDSSPGRRAANARAESLDARADFRDAFRNRRCLIPASGFYEWRRRAGRKVEAPYYFTQAREADPLVFAGIWDRWEGGGERIRSFAIITTGANAQVGSVHNRMPAILDRKHWADWLNPNYKDLAYLQSLLRPVENYYLQCWRVGSFANNARHEGERCLAQACG